MSPRPGRRASQGAMLTAVAAGGAIGASCRWVIEEAGDHRLDQFPWATLLINVVGSIGIGLAARSMSRGDWTWAFLVTGVLGGFTTFSTFAVEVDRLVAADRGLVAVAYVAASVVAGGAGHAVARGARRPGRAET